MVIHVVGRSILALEIWKRRRIKRRRISNYILLLVFEWSLQISLVTFLYKTNFQNGNCTTQPKKTHYNKIFLQGFRRK